MREDEAILLEIRTLKEILFAGWRNSGFSMDFERPRQFKKFVFFEHGK